MSCRKEPRFFKLEATRTSGAATGGGWRPANTSHGPASSSGPHHPPLTAAAPQPAAASLANSSAPQVPAKQPATAAAATSHAGTEAEPLLLDEPLLLARTPLLAGPRQGAGGGWWRVCDRYWWGHRWRGRGAGDGAAAG